MLLATLSDQEGVDLRVEGTELRVDFLKEAAFNLAGKAKQPFVLTLRRKDQGGAFEGLEEERFKQILSYLKLHPSYVDLESDVPLSFVEKIKEKAPLIQLITSFHDFEKKGDLEEIFQNMQKPYSTFYKMALTPQSSSELLEMMLFLKEHPSLTVIGMGKWGKPSRVLGKIFGNAFSYAGKKGDMPPLYQMSCDELHDVYNWERLSSSTRIFGLIGDPIDQSPGHLFHNAYFKELAIDAVYLKFPLEENDLPSFLAYGRGIFSGLSVTRPFKEKILPFLDEVAEDAQKMGAVNTLLFEKGKIKGFNTDGKGALTALEKEFPRIDPLIILGSGGAAKAIYHEGIKRGLTVKVAARSKEKREKIAGTDGIFWDEIPSCGVMVNTIPSFDPSLVPLSSHYGVMDIAHDPQTEFLKEARKKGCKVLSGYGMYQEQALLQQKIWNNKE